MLIWLNNKYYKVLIMLSCTEVTVMLVWLYKFYPVFFKMLIWLYSRNEYLVIIMLLYCSSIIGTTKVAIMLIWLYKWYYMVVLKSTWLYH